MEKRKQREKELHNYLRVDIAGDQKYHSNKKFYSISQTNRDYVKRWLSERCKGSEYWIIAAGMESLLFGLQRMEPMPMGSIFKRFRLKMRLNRLIIEELVEE